MHIRFSCFLIGWLTLPAFLGTVSAGTSQDQLRISILNGEGLVNDTKKRAEVSLDVRVENADGSPAAGARVEVVAPERGPGGTFANGSTMISVTADETGTAQVKGFRPNNLAGSFEFTVTA